MFRRSIIGRTRDFIKSKLATADPIAVALDLEKRGNQQGIRVGNISTVPSHSAIKKMAQEEISKKRLDPDPFTEVGKLAQKQKSEIQGKKLDGHIQEIAQMPFSVIMHGEKQLKYSDAVCRQGNVRAHIDATGSLVRTLVSLFWSIVAWKCDRCDT